MGDLGKLIVVKNFKKFPKVQIMAQSGHTAHVSSIWKDEEGKAPNSVSTTFVTLKLFGVICQDQPSGPALDRPHHILQSLIPSKLGFSIEASSDRI